MITNATAIGRRDLLLTVAAAMLKPNLPLAQTVVRRRIHRYPAALPYLRHLIYPIFTKS